MADTAQDYPAAIAATAKPVSEKHGWLALAAGLGISLVIAVIAWELGALVPVVGAPIFAIIIGVVLANTVGGASLNSRLRINDISGYALRGGIIVLGLTLNLSDVLHTGLSSVALLAVTISAGLAFALLVGKSLGVDWRIPCLIGIGTTICGASAIAALAPVLRAKSEEIAYSISVIFLFNMLAVFIFPAIGHWIGLSDNGFGLWAGTAVNDTSAVVATGFAFSKAAGTYATVVKLTRTTLIIPLVLGFGLALPWIDPEHRPATGTDLMARMRKVIPWFIGVFLLASLINTVGLVGGAAPHIQLAARFILVLALAAVGLQGYWRAFAGAGFRPLALGLGTWATVAITSLIVQNWAGQL